MFGHSCGVVFRLPPGVGRVDAARGSLSIAAMDGWCSRWLKAGNLGEISSKQPVSCLQLAPYSSGGPEAGTILLHVPSRGASPTSTSLKSRCCKMNIRKMLIEAALGQSFSVIHGRTSAQ